MTSINVPTSGILRRTGVDVDVIVGRFDQIDKQTDHGKEKILLPDLTQCTPPLKLLRHTNTPANKKYIPPPSSTSSSSSSTTTLSSTNLTSHTTLSSTNPSRYTPLDNTDTITIQDSSGKHVYLGTKQELDNNYIIIVKDNSSSSSISNNDSITNYQVLPVSYWYTFVRQGPAPALSITEQQELYDIIQSSGPRPSAVRAAMYRLQQEENGNSSNSRLANEGGIANDDTLELVDGDHDREGNYRTSYLESIRHRGSTGKRGRNDYNGNDDDGTGVTLEREGDFEAAYAELDGGVDNDDDYGTNNRRRGYAGMAVNEDGLTKSYDFTGFEGNADEQAADVIQDYFVDDEGDDGRLNADDVNFVIGGTKGEDDEEGAAYIKHIVGQDDDNDIDGIDLDNEDIDADKLINIATGINDARNNANNEAVNRKKTEDITDENLRDIKRGRIDDRTIRAELISFLKSQGGQAPKNAIIRNFESHAKDKSFRKRFFALLAELTKFETHIDGVEYFVLNQK